MMYSPICLSGYNSLKALLFDIDGTLYSQQKLRMAMMLELARSACTHPITTGRDIQCLRHFRKQRELLRDEHCSQMGLEVKQYHVVQEKYGLQRSLVKAAVEKWIFQKPLPNLSHASLPGLGPFLATCSRLSLHIGALSDYPTESKVRALGVERYFDLHLCSTDKGINAFKPSPAGIQRACEIWGLKPSEIVYVGDRPEVDGLAAERAGSHFVLMGHRNHDRYRAVKDFRGLGRLLLQQEGWQQEGARVYTAKGHNGQG